MDTSESRSGEKGIKSLETAVSIVELLIEHERLHTTEIAERLGYSKSNVHYYLKTLERARFLVNDDGGYRIGLRFRSVGDAALIHYPMYDPARRVADKLARETPNRVQVAVEEHGRIVYVYSTEDETGRQALWRDSEAPVHCTASGKAILSCLPEAEILDIIERHGIPKLAQNTITDRDELLDHLAAVTSKGYAFEDFERAANVRAIGAPIRDEDGPVLGAIEVLGTGSEISDPEKHAKARRFQENLPTRIRQAAREIADDAT